MPFFYADWYITMDKIHAAVPFNETVRNSNCRMWREPYRDEHQLSWERLVIETPKEVIPIEVQESALQLLGISGWKPLPTKETQKYRDDMAKMVGDLRYGELGGNFTSHINEGYFNAVIHNQYITGESHRHFKFDWLVPIQPPLDWERNIWNIVHSRDIEIRWGGSYKDTNGYHHLRFYVLAKYPGYVSKLNKQIVQLDPSYTLTRVARETFETGSNIVLALDEIQQSLEWMSQANAKLKTSED